MLIVLSTGQEPPRSRSNPPSIAAMSLFGTLLPKPTWAACSVPVKADAALTAPMHRSHHPCAGDRAHAGRRIEHHAHVLADLRDNTLIRLVGEALGDHLHAVDLAPGDRARPVSLLHLGARSSCCVRT